MPRVDRHRDLRDLCTHRIRILVLGVVVAAHTGAAARRILERNSLRRATSLPSLEPLVVNRCMRVPTTIFLPARRASIAMRVLVTLPLLVLASSSSSPSLVYPPS